MSTVTERNTQTKINTNTGKFEITWTFWGDESNSRVLLRRIREYSGHVTYNTTPIVNTIEDLHDLRDALSEFFVEVSKQGLMHRK